MEDRRKNLEDRRKRARDRRKNSDVLGSIITLLFRTFVVILLILIFSTGLDIKIMLTDILNQQNTIVLELDKQSIDDTAENRSTAQIEPLGTFTVTHYCSCPICCGEWADGITATGTQATEGRTIAVDKNVIPLGSKVIIDNHEYIAEDIGGAIKGNKVDIFVSDHETAIQRGKIQREVELVR
jgi:3D (Asp-Asp-Asp) domain-containing protein